jgi:hypothetical protein
MLTRRSFVGLFGLLPVFGVAKSSSKKEYLDGVNPEAKTFYRGYHIKWTGWKQAQGHDLEFGQWIAYPCFREEEWTDLDNSRPFLVVSSPGRSGIFNRGDCFDLTLQPDQIVITWNTKPAVKERIRKYHGRRLIKMIDRVMDSGKRGLSYQQWDEIIAGGKHANL